MIYTTLWSLQNVSLFSLLINVTVSQNPCIMSTTRKYCNCITEVSFLASFATRSRSCCFLLKQKHPEILQAERLWTFSCGHISSIEEVTWSEDRVWNVTININNLLCSPTKRHYWLRLKNLRKRSFDDTHIYWSAPLFGQNCSDRTFLCIGGCIFSRPIWLYKTIMKKLL